MCAWVRIDSQASAGAAADSQASTDADPSGTDATAHTEPVRLQRTVSTRRVTAYSADHDHQFRAIVITGSADGDHSSERSDG